MAADPFQHNQKQDDYAVWRNLKNMEDSGRKLDDRQKKEMASAAANLRTQGIEVEGPSGGIGKEAAAQSSAKQSSFSLSPEAAAHVASGPKAAGYGSFNPVDVAGVAKEKARAERAAEPIATVEPTKKKPALPPLTALPAGPPKKPAMTALGLTPDERLDDKRQGRHGPMPDPQSPWMPSALPAPPAMNMGALGGSAVPSSPPLGQPALQITPQQQAANNAMRQAMLGTNAPAKTPSEFMKDQRLQGEAGPMPDVSKDELARRRLVKEITEQQFALEEKTKLALDPEVIQQRVKLRQQEAEAARLVAAATDAEAAKQGGLVEKARTDEDRRLSALKSANVSLENQRQALANINALLAPDVLRERVAMTLQMEQAQRKGDEATRAERAKQGGVSGFFGGAGELAGAVGGMGGSVGQMGGAMANLFGALSKATAGMGLPVMTGGAAGAGVPGGAPAASGTGEAIPEAQRPAIQLRKPALPDFGRPQGKAFDFGGGQGKAALTGGGSPKLPAFGGGGGAGAIGGGTGGVSAAAGGVGKAAGGLAGTLGKVGGAMSSMASKAGPWGAAAAAAFQAIGAGVSMLKGMANQIVSMGGKASPVALRQFNLAMADMQAVIGRVAVPALELMGKGIRLVGDMLASVLPTASEMKTAFAPLDESMKEIRETMKDIAPLLKEVVKDAMMQLGLALKGLAMVINTALKPIQMMAQLMRQLGLIGGKQDLKTSVGAAAGPATTRGLEEHAKSVYTSAFSSGVQTPGGKEDTTTPLGRLIETVKRMEAYLEKISNFKIPGGDTAGKLTDKVREGGNRVLGWVGL